MSSLAATTKRGRNIRGRKPTQEQERHGYLEGVHHPVQELDNEQRRDLALDDGHKVDPVAEDADEVVVRRGDDGRHVLGLGGALLRLEEVVAHGAAHHTLPVLLQEDVPGGVHQEQAVDHLWTGGLAEDRTGPERQHCTTRVKGALVYHHVLALISRFKIAMCLKLSP